MKRSSKPAGHMKAALFPSIALGIALICMTHGSPKAEADTARAKGSWDQTADFGGPAVRGAAAFAIGRHAYVVSGLANDGQRESLVPQVWQFDAADNSWNRKADFPGTPRLDSTGFSIDQKGYVGLGSDNKVGLTDFWEYDSQTDAWTRKGDFPGGMRILATPLLIGQKAYVIAGSSSSGPAKDVWEYDPRSDGWTRKADLPGTARRSAAGFVIGNKGYFGTGIISGPPFTAAQDFWEFDPQSDQWTRMADFPGAGRGYAIGFSLGNKGYIGTGMLNLNSTGTSLVLAKDLWEYNPRNNTWTRQPDLPGSGRAMTVGFVIGTFGYIGTGSKEDVQNLKDFWRFSLLQLGDLDRSGQVDAVDLTLLSLNLAGRVRPENAPFTAPAWSGDLNGDDEVSSSDNLLLAAVLADNESLNPSGATLALINGTLIDGTGAAPISDAVLAIDDGGTIVASGRRGSVRIPAGTKVIDVQGGTILPGFINSHVHDAYSAANLEAWAYAGVTTVRDECINRSGVLLKDLIVERDTAWSLPRHARLISAGWMITAPGGYGRLGVTTADEATRRVVEELDAGADLIKVAVEDGIAGRTDLPVLSTAALEAAVAAAHARGRPVSAHVTDARFLQTIVDAGVDDAAHATWDPVSDELFRRMIARHITMVPTLTVLEAYGSLAGARANLRRFVTLGGHVALGNDYTDIPQNNFPHFELGMPMHEIERMAESGMTATQIIVAATRNAAHVCGLDDKLGTLETGKTADILVVNGDPLQNLNALTDVRLVIHRGVVIRGQ